MADYHTLIKRAVERADGRTGEARRAIYEKARNALVKQLRSLDPPLGEAEITRQRLALEDAIRKVEAEMAEALVRDAATALGRLEEEPIPAATPAQAPAPALSPPAPVTGLPALRAPAAGIPLKDAVARAGTLDGAIAVSHRNAREQLVDVSHGESDRVEPRFGMSNAQEAPVVVGGGFGGHVEEGGPEPDVMDRPKRISGRAVAACALLVLFLAGTLAYWQRDAFVTLLGPSVGGVAELDEAAVQQAAAVPVPAAAAEAEPVEAEPDQIEPDQIEPDEIEPGQASPESAPSFGAGLASSEPPASPGETRTFPSLAPARIGPSGKIEDRLPQEGDEPEAPAATNEPIVTAVAEPAVAASAPAERGQAVPTEGTVVAPAEGSQTAAAVAAVPPSAGSAAPLTQGEVLPIAQRAVLYEEGGEGGAGAAFTGTVSWRTEPDEGAKPGLLVRGLIEVPERGVKLLVTFRRNTDPALPASHTVELLFEVPPGFQPGGIANVPGILMKANEPARGTALAGASARVTDGYFLVGLSSAEVDRQRNVELLKAQSWIDIPILYGNNRRAILTIEKGIPGERAFQQAFASWPQ